MPHLVLIVVQKRDLDFTLAHMNLILVHELLDMQSDLIDSESV